MTPSATSSGSRTMELAETFLEEIRREVDRAAPKGMDLPPRLRSIHERPGHATPEYRSFAVPVPDAGGTSPETLSKAIARYAATKRPAGLVLALEAVLQDDDGQPQSVLIAEARDASGTRRFLMQPYQVDGARVRWAEPMQGGWRDPGREEMILDAAFPDHSARVREG